MSELATENESIVELREVDTGSAVLVLTDSAGLTTIHQVLTVAQRAANLNVDITVETSKCSFVDTAVWQVLLALGQSLQARGKCLHLNELSSKTQEYLHISGLQSIFTSFVRV